MLPGLPRAVPLPEAGWNAMAPDGPRLLCKAAHQRAAPCPRAAVPFDDQGDFMSLRDAMRDSAAPYLGPGEPVQAVIGAQTASQWLAALTGIFVFLGFNHY